MSEFQKKLGRSAIVVSAMGMGCWQIGGSFLQRSGSTNGWGKVDDAESIRAINHVIDLGVNFFDTSDIYGAGHSETVLGQAIAGKRDKLVIATKFGYTFDEAKRLGTGEDISPDYIRRALIGSLRRLNTDYIDLYQLHIGSLPEETAIKIIDTLDDLQKGGFIRAYAWSTSEAELAEKLFAPRQHCAAIQYTLNIFRNNTAMVSMCEKHNLASIARSPLAMGLLSGKFTASSLLPPDDIRGGGVSWVSYFENGRPRPELLAKLSAIREILSSNGRTLAQGALAWIWGRTPSSIPIPGFKTVEQAVENATAMKYGPLSPGQMDEIEKLLSI